MSSYYINITDNGSGLFTVAAGRGGTPGSGGTSLPGGGSDLLANVSTTQLGTAIEVAQLVCINDRVAGN